MQYHEDNNTSMQTFRKQIESVRNNLIDRALIGCKQMCCLESVFSIRRISCDRMNGGSTFGR